MWGLAFGYTRYGLVVLAGALPAASYLAGLVNGMVMLWLSWPASSCC